MEENVQKKNLFVKIKTFILDTKKKLVIKLNNYRLTSLIVFIISIACALVAIGYLVSYEFAGEHTSAFQFTAFYDENGDLDGGKMAKEGMVFFLAAIISIILSIAAGYLSYAPIRNKDLIQIRKTNIILTIANGALHLIDVILTIVLFNTTKYEINTKTGFVISMIFSIICAIACALLLIPLLNCTFYQPKIKDKKAKPAEQVAEAK